MQKITQCRACGSSALSAAFSLDHMQLSSKRARKSSSVEYVLCDSSQDPYACGLLQYAHDGVPVLPQDPVSASYRFIRAHLRAVATESLETISGRDCSALDIGCNDGTLLSFYPRWVERFGIDVGDSVKAVGDWASTIQCDYASQEAEAFLGDRKFDIITAVSVLDRLDNPRALFSRMKDFLADDGVIALETLYAPIAVAQANFEAFTSGARAVYSLNVLEQLAREFDLKIFRGALTDKEGGSIRLFLTHNTVDAYDFDPWYERLARLWDEENALSLRCASSYRAFEMRANAARETYKAILAGIKARGESAFILTAGSHASSAHFWAEETLDAISAAVGDKPTGMGEYLCTNGPVVLSEGDCRAAEPEYLIAPAAFKREMMERWREAIMLGAKLLVPSPEPHIVDAGNFATEYGKTLAGGDQAGEVETLRAILSIAGGPRLVSDMGPLKEAV